jgi:S-adenosylmethionine:tRNA ribosyltransferase-isomerase
MHPKELSINDFRYVLPPERIAQQPLPQRDQSKLLVYKEGLISENVFANITSYLPENATLVFNDTKVIHARLIFKNEHNATIEVFLLEPVLPFSDMQLAIFQHTECTWRCLVGNVKKWREEFLTRKIKVGDEEGILKVNLAGKIEEDFLVHFSWTPGDLSFAKVIGVTGYVPLPPYIKRHAHADDDERYQTLYAFQDGSVAAPTAGLHFSDELFNKLHEKNIQPLFITLHVGAGTFLPVKSATMNDHHMHAEHFVVRRETIEQLIERKGKPLVAVGTTSCRTLESLYWLGAKCARENSQTITDKLPAVVQQWEPYEKNGW